MFDKFKMLITFILPHHLISRCMGFLVRSKNPLIKNFLINLFIKTYHVNMMEAERETAIQYQNFVDFFSRKLKISCRKLDLSSQNIICPIDGYVSQGGKINNQQIFQAKEHYFSIRDLLGGNQFKELAAQFSNGEFLNAYLSPKDYHRIHMPITGKLLKTIYVPGRLFSVSPLAVEMIPNLFARNERLIAIFDTAIGRVAIILVGAFYVASINTVWGGEITPPTTSKIIATDYSAENFILQQGEELGHFNLGSTVILLFEKNKITWSKSLASQQPLILGENLAKIN